MSEHTQCATLGLARGRFAPPFDPPGGPRSGGVRGWGARPPNPLAGALMADRGTELFEGRQRLFEGCLAEPRSWVQHLVIRGSQRELGLGSVSLPEAREKARANRKLAREGGRTARRETSDAGHAELGRSRRARGAAEAGRLAQSEVRPRLDVEPEAVHLPAHRRDAGLGGAERRRRLDGGLSCLPQRAASAGLRSSRSAHSSALLMRSFIKGSTSS